MMDGSEFWNRLGIAGSVIFALWNLFAKGQLLGFLGDWMEKHGSEWFTKPLAFCPPCMASVHGTWVWFLTGGDVSKWWPIFILALSGLMVLVVRILPSK